VNIVGEIKYHLDENVYAHLKYSESRASFSIDIVFVPVSHRNRGIGSFLINHILLLADSMGKGVYLSARPIGSQSEGKLQRLIAYYKRFGFEIYDTGQTVAYMSRKTPTSPA
jgi:GNAT superfamily N-acetyltransferase